MRAYLRARRRRRAGRDTGITMVAVLVGLTIILTVVLGSLAYLTAATRSSRYQQDNDLALTAAQSGVNELLSRLRTNPGYLTDVTSANGYCASHGVGGPSSENDYFQGKCACDDSSKVKWWPVSDEVGAERQEYHVAITSYWATAEVAAVVASGRSQKVVRSMKVRQARSSTPTYLYLSNYEVVDPTDYAAYPEAQTSLTCGRGWPEDATKQQLGQAWEIELGLKPPRYHLDGNNISQPCAEPSFERWDVFDGPVHSNDTIIANGMRFMGEFSTSDPDCGAVVPGESSTYAKCYKHTGDTAVFDQVPFYKGRKKMEDRPDAGKIGTDGCHYLGPTRIILNGQKMKVWSKLTTQQVWDDLNLSPGEIADKVKECGSYEPLHTTSAEVDVPDGGIVYVKKATVPQADGMSDAQKQAYGEFLASKIDSRYIDGTLPLGSYSATKLDPVSPQKYQIEAAMEDIGKLYSAGNLWLEGEVDGGVTVFADESIIVTGDLMTAHDYEDLIGLMAGGSIEIYNPVLITYTPIKLSGLSEYVWSEPSEVVKR